MSRIRMRALALPVLCAALSCGASGPDSQSMGVPSDDHRFELEITTLAAEAHPSLRLRVTPRSGWKLVPESPARLSARAPAGWRFVSAEQRSEDALEYSEKRLEFGLELRSEGAQPPGDGGSAELKFGVCRSDSSHCELVRERFALPLGEALARSERGGA